jgi:tetratricopeptide (TPR) repeat protein
MKLPAALITATVLLFSLNCYANDKAAPGETNIDAPLYKPFIERYILDELKLIRQDQQALRAEMADKVADARLDASDRAIRYTADTTSTIFYIITAAASILVLLGWRSLHDIRDNIESVTSQKLAELTKEYEDRLNEMESKIRQRSEQIISTQQEISNTNLVHSLWMRAGLEKSDQEKIKIYDHILEINPDDIEAMTYKADALLDIGEKKWALSLSNQAIEQDNNYALAYWQRACAHAALGQHHEAIEDLRLAISLSESLKEEIDHETYFEPLRSLDEYRQLFELPN